MKPEYLPKYPIYILSKGRWDSRLTSKTLEALNVPYRIVVEDNEYDNYAAVIDPKKIITLPTDFREDPRYAIKDNSGLIGGGIPVRNFIWEHSIAEGHKRHWILDDNIRHFYRLHKNTKFVIKSGVCFRSCEDFTDRYENVVMSGMNYDYFAPMNEKRPPYYKNTRIYSCILLDNTRDFRWRGMYNEDTDLSLRFLKAGYCTILFHNFLCGKVATHAMKGGNTETVYKVGDAEYDKRRKFAESLQAQHPDVVDIVWRYQRFHHEVNYNKFIQENQLILKPEFENIPNVPNNYGLVLGRMKDQ